MIFAPSRRAPADRPGGTGTRQDTAPVMAAGSSPGSRSRRGPSCLSCFLRWVFTGQSMKTTNAENDGKANDRQSDILTGEDAIDPSEIAFLEGVRHGLLRAHVYTVPDSALRAKVDELIREATADFETLEAVFRRQSSLWYRVKSWLALPAFAFRQWPVATTLYFAFLLSVAFAYARAYGWL